MTNAVAIAVVGLASWFHPHRTTHNGYYVCATRLYPKGSLVEVTERHNGSKVVVIVDDFGAGRRPTSEGVIIDLCPEAFLKLDGLPLGRADVSIVSLRTGPSTAARPR